MEYNRYKDARAEMICLFTAGLLAGAFFMNKEGDGKGVRKIESNTAERAEGDLRYSGTNNYRTNFKYDSKGRATLDVLLEEK